MKEFYGSVSLAGRIDFAINAEDEKHAEEIVFEDIEGIEIYLKNGSKLEIGEIDWNLINRAARGNIQEYNIDDFEIYEEK